MGPQTFQAADAEAEQGREALTCWNGAAKLIRGRSIKHTSIRIFLAEIISELHQPVPSQVLPQGTWPEVFFEADDIRLLGWKVGSR